MTARVLVVDDIVSNVKLLEAKLTAEYFNVMTASSGEQALQRVAAENPDIVLLDVMMPGMDGFEVCNRIKRSADTAHIPVVMITALDQTSDRVAGLDAGADDFLTKPVDDLSLFARVRSLVRMKTMTDELRMREETARSMGLTDSGDRIFEADPTGNILIVEDRPESVAWFRTELQKTNKVADVSGFDEALALAKGGDFDLIVASLGIRAFDGLRLCSHFRSLPELRNTPILAIASDSENRKLAQALDMGVNDYLMRPIDRNELLARVKTQLRKKKYADKLRHNVRLGLEMALKDPLTGLYNRRYMVRHLDTLMKNASESKPLSFVIMDIDFFNSINNTHGHDAGDEVLRQFAARLTANVRGTDLACRYGGEEFIVLMPDTDSPAAYAVAERLRHSVELTAFAVGHAPEHATVTVSIGIASTSGEEDAAENLLRRADRALYRAKREGRNRVIAEAA
jgi:two-component system, cell cycle response regulator